MFAYKEINIFLDTVERHEMSMFFETVPKKNKNNKTHRPVNEHIHRDSPKKTKNTKAHRPRTKHIRRDSPKKTKNTKAHRPLNEHILRDSPKKKQKNQRFQAIGVVLRNGFWDSSESLVFSVFLGLSR